MWRERGNDRKSETDTGRGRVSRALRDTDRANTLRWKEADTENQKVGKLGGQVSRALHYSNEGLRRAGPSRAVTHTDTKRSH